MLITALLHLTLQECGQHVSSEKVVWVMSLTECNAGTTKKFPSALNTTIELKDISNTSDNSGALLIQDTPRQMPVLSDVAILLSSISVLNTNGQFLDCATIAYGERHGQAASQKGLWVGW